MKGQGSKLLSKLMNISTKKKVVLFTAFTLVNALALSAATIAWFDSVSKNASIDAVAGDINVSIEKVTVYKFVYPFYASSAEFINYDDEENAVVKAYVIQDKDVASTAQNPLDSDDVEITLGTIPGAVAGQSDTPGPRKIKFTNRGFRYYLYGNETFTGFRKYVDQQSDTHNPDSEWSTVSGTAFSKAFGMDDSDTVALTDIVISAGAEFSLFDANTTLTTTSYFTYTFGATKRFEATESGAIRCIQSGIYDIEYNPTQSKLSISLSNRSDETIIGNSTLDSTKINIDFWGSPAIQTAYQNDIKRYVPQAIYEQNTMAILDVQLRYINANPITAGLKIQRTAELPLDNSIHHLADRYEDHSAHLEGATKTRRNALRASDFYCFSARFASAANAYTDPDSIWSAMRPTPTAQNPYQTGYAKFLNGQNYDQEIPCPLVGDSTTILGSDEGSVYHCYVGIDYCGAYIPFFLDLNRLGKQYFLDRDFFLYFTGTQVEGA